MTLNPGESTSLGFFAAFGNITTVATGPTASIVSANDITAAAQTEDITVTFNDQATVDASTITGDEINITGPNGFSQNATLLSTGLVNGNSVTATYRLAPNGGFGTIGNGTYSINYVGSSTLNLKGNGNAQALAGDV